MSLPLIIGILVVLLIVAVVLSQRSGPRITTIERKTEHRDEDRDDA